MLSGSITALITPFLDGESLDEGAWVELLDWHRQSGTAGVVVGGTTGESVNLTASEFDRLLFLALERVGDSMRVLAGTGSPSTQETLVRTRAAARAGAHAALVVTPAYNRPTQRGLELHYRAVADVSDIPVVLYNVPSRTACDLSPETVSRLADHPNIVAIKEAVGDRERVRALLATGLTVLSGDDPSCCQAMLAGAAGVISVAANVDPRRMAELCRRASQGEEAQARSIDRELMALYGFLGAESNPIPVKWMLHRMGRIGTGLRLPLTPLDPAYRDEADRLIDTLRLDAVPDVA
jgi:4-hydroxy-tetrahydrodipicolinate synthase